MAANDNFPVDYGDYRLLRKVAQGGMAEIFLAQDKKGSICAIKRILPHLAHEESFIRMFIDEARIVSHLQHPNIAGVYDQGKVDGYYYIAMEFVQGHSLLAVSERAKSMKIPLPRGLLAFVASELLAGLACAHSARDSKGRHLGIVHRDVTPQNVLIGYDGSVKLIDFGVAKARARLTQTEAGFTKGKLSYMSPEQARGEELDGRSDLFSVGIIVHEITTNSRLFNKEGPGGILGAIVNDPIPPPSLKVKEYPKELESIVMKALDKDLHRRWQSAEEMQEALLRWSKKEKPPPSSSRLKDLIHDLFGEPESQKWINEAQAGAAPTPAQVEAHGFIRDGQVRARSALESKRAVAVEPQAEMEKAPEDETRMLRPEHSLRHSAAKVSKLERKLEITSPGVPAVEMSIPGDERPVPEPLVPLRVRLARFMLALALDLRVSWRERPGRWIGGGIGALIGLLFLGGLITGGVGSVFGWFAGAGDKVREMRVSAGLSQDRPDAGAKPTVLRLASEPPGASIVVDGVGLGTVTPHDIADADLPLSRPVAIELSLAGYRTQRQMVTLYPGQGLREMSFTLERQLGGLEISSDPPGATISVNGKKMAAATPATLNELPAGEPITVKVVKKGYLAQSKMIVPGDGETRSLDFKLEIDQGQIPNGSISVDSTPPGCRVLLDDAPVGSTPLSSHDASPGAHSVKVVCENYEAESRAVSVTPNGEQKLSFALRPNVFGYLTIVALPAGTEVSVNGKAVPMPVEFLKVIPGRHVVALANRGLNLKKEWSIDVPPNARITRTLNLYQ